MKSVKVLARILFVGVIWSIFFIEGIRVVMLTNWRFDIFQLKHWLYAWNLWYSGAWIIDDSKEWAFVLIIFSFIPLWLTGWAALSLIAWENSFARMSAFILALINKIFYSQVQTVKKAVVSKTVQKKKSYKEVRPKSLRSPIEERAPEPITITTAAPMPSMSRSAPSRKPARPIEVNSTPTEDKKNFDHSLFKFDSSEEDFDFNFDAFDTAPAPAKEEDKPAERQEREPRKKDDYKAKDKDRNKDKKDRPERQDSKPQKSSGNSVMEVLKQKGFEVITGATVKNNLIDFIGVSDEELILCLCDKDTGDWLADEERFNDEEPLWFSESSHRISPVRKVDLSRQFLINQLKEADISLKIRAFVIEQIGNIINAEDMFDTWKEMDIFVTRIDRGSPKELKLFAKALPEASKPADKGLFDKVKKLFRSAE